GSRTLFQLPDDATGVVVTLVHPDGAAAGLLHPGDLITAVGSQPVHTLDDYVTDSSADAVTLTIGAANRRVVTITPEPLPLPFVVTLIKTPVSNAGARDDQILVTTGLLDLVENDDQLAAVLGHELGHVTEGHVRLTPQKVANRVLTTTLLI